MIKKKLLAGIMSAFMLISSISVMPLKVSAATQLFNDTFENGTDSWTSRGDATIATVTNAYHSGSKSLKITGRASAWNGAGCNKDGTLAAGNTYSLNCWVMYDTGEATENIKFQLMYNDASGTESYAAIANVDAVKGTWAQISNTAYTIPTGATNLTLYVETPTNLIDFYLDDVTCSGNSTPITPISTDLGLKDIYKNYFKIGTCLPNQLVSNASIKNIILKDFNSITFENELKPDSVLNYNASVSYYNSTGDQTNPQISLNSASNLLNFCAQNKIAVRGHCLVWHSQTPDWFFKEGYNANGNWVSKTVMLQRMENYIKNVMNALATQYPTVNVYAWDVVNEAFSDNGTPRNPGSNNVTQGNSAWVQIFGDNSFIEYAFTYARKYAPSGCKLFYNDYNEYIPSKRDAIYNMASSLKSKGVIDGVGMQSHLSMTYPDASLYEQALAKYAQLGLEIQVTELDITTTDTSSSGFTAQATKFAAIMSAIKKYKDNVTAVVFWGITDNNSWRSSGYPLLYNSNYTAKPCYNSIVALVDPSEYQDTTLYGDVYIDGKVDAKDLSYLAKYTAGVVTMTDEQKKNADCYLDNTVSVKDLSKLAKYIAGIQGITLGTAS